MATNQDDGRIVAGRVGQKRRNTIFEQLMADAENIINRDNFGKIIRSPQSIVPLRMPSIIDEDLSQSQSQSQRRQSFGILKKREREHSLYMK